MVFLYNTVLGVLRTSPCLKSALKDYSLKTCVEEHQIYSIKLSDIPNVGMTTKGLGVCSWAMIYRC